MPHDQDSHRLSHTDLDEFLRQLALEEETHPDLSQKVIEDYIEGRSNAGDRALVETAMARSGELREEILAYAAIGKRESEFAALVAPRAPARRTTWSPAPAPVKKSLQWPRRPATLLAFCGLLAVAVAAWLLSPVSPIRSPDEPALYAASFDRTLTDEQFEVGVERSSGQEPSFPAPRNQRDAVLMSLFEAIEWRDGDFLIHPTSPEASGEKEYRLTFDLKRQGGTTTWPYKVRLPRDAETPQTAILVFPDLTLHWVETHAWKGRVAFDQDPGQSLFLSVAYRLKGEYHASPPIQIPPP